MKHSSIKMIAVGGAVGLLALLILVAALWTDDPSSLDPGASESLINVAQIGSADWLAADQPVLDQVVAAKVEAFCGDCHAVPSPSSYARNRWGEEIKRGYEFYARSGRSDLAPPTPQQTLAYYLAQAPVQQRFDPPTTAAEPLRATWSVEKRFVDPAGRLPEVSALIWTPLQAGGKPMLVAADMKYGQIVAIDPQDAAAAPIILARLEHPAHIEPVTLSGDGSAEFLIADLGSYMPAEEPRGRVILLRRAPGAAAFETIVLASGFARVADVRAADFDGDEKPDLLVAEFGWQKNGGIWLLRNVTQADGPLRFERERIDHRPGTIHLPIHDFNADGRADFVALVSQEHEAVDLFLSRPKTNDAIVVQRDRPPLLRLGLWAGPDLTFGSSGLQLCDLDQNGQMDLLLTNGDSWDNLLAVPTHGVHWLENRGDYQFQHHRLASLPGAYATTTLDVDHDGDLDVIAVAWLSPNVQPETVAGGKMGSIICLEQVKPGVFVRHTLETGSPFYSSVVSGDFDGDGRADFAVASGPMVAEDRQQKFYLSIWWNRPATTASP